MANNPIPLMLLLTAIVFVIGAAVGYFAFKYGARKAAPQPINLPPPDPRKTFLVEQVELWREKASSRLVIWFEGKPLNSPQSLDEARRAQLVSAGREFLAWLGVNPGAVDSSEKPSASEGAERSIPAAAPVVSILPTPAADEPVVPGEAAVGPARPLTIVEQIDDILQEMIKKEPTLSARAIRLLEDPREGAVVWIGLEHFNGVDSVPYPEVKAVLRQAAAEWERRTERTRR